MRMMVRSNLVGTTALLSLLALGAIFAAVLDVVPAGSLPEHRRLIAVIPHLNAGISLVAIGTIGAGVRSIRAGDVDRHRRFMLTSTGLFATFLLAYLYKIVVAGTTEYAGPAVIRQFVYLPTLLVHTVLAIVTVPLVIYVLLLAATHTVEELPQTAHPRVGRIAASLWAVSFAFGVLVYALLYVVG